jgi:phosphoglycolate phosphatase-like HAD superfamily hydrolase
VGDGVWDARACRSLRWPFIGIASHAANIEKLRAEGAIVTMPHFADSRLLLSALAL